MAKIAKSCQKAYTFLPKICKFAYHTIKPDILRYIIRPNEQKMKSDNTTIQYTTHIAHIALTLILCLMAIYTPHTQALPLEHYATHSMLSSGKWYKISVTESGIHQISYSQLKSWGFNDPSRVRIYGYGGKVLSEIYSDSDIDDLPQIPVIHNNNRILFYA